jgi:transposase
MSQGTICNLLKNFTAKSAPAYALIAQKVMGAKAVGTDETGIKVDGKKGRYWAWQYGSATYIVFSENRGIATIDLNFPSGLPNAVLVHDCWASHFRTACRTHQLCTAHLLRELVYFTERYASEWAMEFRELIYRGLKLKKKIDPDGYGVPIPERDGIKEKLADLLDRPLPEGHKDLRAFHKRMIKYRGYILTFLYHHEVPPDNNASERAIRNVKVKQKVSGQFKTVAGAQAYAVIRSVTDTCVKNGQSVLGAFKTIATLLPE